MSVKYLKYGTLLCPRDKQNLEFETFQGMRVFKSHEGQRLFQARCPKCGYYWGVHA